MYDFSYNKKHNWNVCFLVPVIFTFLHFLRYLLISDVIIPIRYAFVKILVSDHENIGRNLKHM